MHITEFDEWQGLTADMVREWFAKESIPTLACPAFAVCPQLGDHTHHGRTVADDVTIPTVLCGNRWQSAMISSGLGWIAANRNISLQALLREINPRTRKGVPSGAAIIAHEASGGHWLAKSSQDGGVLRMLRWSVTDAAAKLDALDASQNLHRDTVPPSWHFWPCDEHGNKVRWPTDAEGNMF